MSSQVAMVKLLQTLIEQMNSVLKYLGNISTEIEKIREKVD